MANNSNFLLSAAKRSIAKELVKAGFIAHKPFAGGNLSSANLDSLLPYAYPDLFDQITKASATPSTMRIAQNIARARLGDVRSRVSHWGVVKSQESQEAIRDKAVQESLASGIYGPEMPSEVAIERQRKAYREQMVATEAFRHDSLSGLEQKLEDLTKRYGGGEKGERRALQIIAKNNPFLKAIAKNMPGLTKGLITALPGLKAGLGAASMVFSAWRKVLGVQRGFVSKSVGGGRLGLSKEASLAASVALGGALGGGAQSLAPIGSWNTAIGDMMVGGSTDFLGKLAVYGIDISGSGVGGLATGEEMFDRVTRRIYQYKKQGKHHMALSLAQSAGIDQAAYEAIDHTKGNVLGFVRNIGETADVRKAAAMHETTLMQEIGENAVKNALITNLAKGWDNLMASVYGTVNPFARPEIIKEVREMARNIEGRKGWSFEASTLANQPTTSKQVNINFNGGITVNDVKDGKDFATRIVNDEGFNTVIIEAIDGKKE